MEYKRHDHNFKTKAEKEELLKQIEKTREDLHILIDQFNDINSREVLIESQKLDKLLTEYEELIRKDINLNI